MRTEIYGANPFLVLQSMGLSAIMAAGGLVGWMTLDDPLYRYLAAALGVVGVVLALLAAPTLFRPIRLTLSSDGFELIDGSTRSFVAWSDVGSLELLDETVPMVVWRLKREVPAAVGSLVRRKRKCLTVRFPTD